jgi:hypothetical protein
MSDDHGPQKRPASVNQIEAQLKTIANDMAYDRLIEVLSFVRDDSIAATYQTMGQYRTAILNVLEGKK